MARAQGWFGLMLGLALSCAERRTEPSPACGIARAVATYDFVRAVQMGDGSVWKATGTSPFTRVDGPGAPFKVTDLAASGSSAYSNAIGCGIVNGGVWCFPLAGPLNVATDLGAGSAGSAESLLPQRVVTEPNADAAPLRGATQLAGGMNGSGASFCAVTAAGGIACWGYDESGLLGHGDTEHLDYARPVMLDQDTPFARAVEVRVGFHSSCARQDDGKVWCWGDNTQAQLGYVPAAEAAADTSSYWPIQVPLPRAATRLAASPGDTHCAILNDTSIACWGANGYGQAGASDAEPRTLPTLVLTAANGAPLLGVVDAAPDRGLRAMCANTSNAGLWCWGDAFAASTKQAAGPYAAPVYEPSGDVGPISAPLAAYGEHEGRLVFVDGRGRLVLGAGTQPTAEQPPCP